MNSTVVANINLILPWNQIHRDKAAIAELEKNILPGYIRSCRWFGGKSRKIKSVTINRTLTVNSGTKDIRSFHFFILKVSYSSGKAESYLLPVALVSGDIPVIEKGIIAVIGEHLLIDAIYDADFRATIFNHLLSSAEIKQADGKLIFERGSALAEEDAMSITESRVLDADQSNSSIIYGERFFLKIYRKLFTEINPDVEVTRFLTEEAHFKNIPSFAGSISWKKSSGAKITLGLMQQKVNAVKDAWSLTGDFLNEYLLSLKNNSDAVPETSVHQARALGECTARMHMALACKAEVVAFAPEKFNHHYTRQLVANSEDLVKRRLRMIKDSYASLDEQGKELAKFYIENTGRIRSIFRKINPESFQSLRIRVHGDYHLGQLLYDGYDYTILDFEGEPESSIHERKIRHSGLKDVAGMLRSFHYAVSAKLYFSTDSSMLSSEALERAVIKWYDQIKKSFLDAYWRTIRENEIYQAPGEELEYLLNFHLLEKAVYELGYELNARPTWVKIPLKGIQQVLHEVDPFLMI